MGKFLKRYTLFICVLFVIIVLILINKDIGLNSIKLAEDSFIQMIEVVPPIMILLGLVDVWISREKMMKYMGEDSGLKGIILSIIIASIGAGPMYAAFPFTAVLIKKGVKFSNVITFMNAWCVIKISTVLFEISSLGYNFTFLRLIIDIPGVIIMAYLTEKLMGKDELTKIYRA
ncbi:MAG: permease [Clostridiales bacterium]|uniref:permease n=1 Tax=Clostridium sp. N3C TaxID=1776758 RepID=UPI00092E12D3|nr:permease [Clostridium sp. N3C]NLZ48564.1 permease [Clostridiales bacterium]SCN26047.1 putative permease [Clostridium sp. N3C]